MIKKLQNISLWVIYVGLGVCLATPLLVHSDFFFPFITTKAFVFRIVVEIMLLAYLFLAFSDEKYRPKFNMVFGAATAFILVSIISSLLGGDFYASFWGDMERSEGILLWLHLWAFFVIITAVLTKKETWQRFLDISLAVALLVSLFGIGQSFGLKSILTSGSRVDSTFGNPSFLAAYLFFHIAFAAYLGWHKKSSSWRIYYGASALIFIWVVLATQTRGAALGLVAGVITALILLAWLMRANKKIKTISLASFGLVIVLIGVIYAGRNSAWVQNSEILYRLVRISTQERTAQSRLLTWGAAWEGIKEKPILGWGQENFENLFNKNFPAAIYEDEGSVVWFDRAHNMILDRLATTGLLGLLAFLVFLFYPAYYAFRKLLRHPDTRIPGVIIVALTVAYFVQDLVVFESIAVYVALFFAWAFFTSSYLPNKEMRPALGRKVWLGVAVIYLLLLIPLEWKVNFYPAAMNVKAATAGKSDTGTADFFQVLSKYKEAVEANTYGREEYTLQLVEFVGLQLANLGEVRADVKPVVEYTDTLVARQLAEFPDSAKNWLLAMRHYNYTNASLTDANKEERLKKSLSFYEQAIELSPTRPHFPQEAGFSWLYLYRFNKAEGRTDEANEAAMMAEKFFRQTVELNPKVVESHTNLIMLYLNIGDNTKLDQAINEMEASGAPYQQERYLRRLVNLALGNKNYARMAYFALQIAQQTPNNPQAWIDVALAHAYDGDKTEAIKYANVVKEFGGAYVAEVDEFIKNVNSGFFENNPPQ